MRNHGINTLRRIFLVVAMGGIAAGAFSRIAPPADSQSPSETTTQGPNARFALLIGINDYTDPEIKDLRGTANDVALMRDLLTDPEVGYGFKPSDMLELISAKTGATPVLPTRENIEKAFREHLIGKARAFKEKNPSSDGATVVFYYSGHGSYVDDQATVIDGKDEADGKDETIVPMDSTEQEGSRDITDDEINKWFNELRKYTTNITFIFDSCHSGTVTRGSGNRSVERNLTTTGGGTRGADSLNETMDASESYVTISGSLPNEKSVEDLQPTVPAGGEIIPNAGTRPKMQMNGYLTYYLVQTLRQNQGMTYRELMQLVSSAVTRNNPDQTPQVEGDVDRVFLGSKESRNKRAIAIRKIEKETLKEGDSAVTNSILTIEAGRIVGALPGGSVGIYGANALQLTGDADRLAVGKIFESGNYTSKVRVTGKEVSEKSKVVLANPFFTDEKRKVAVDMSGTGAGLEMINRLKSLLSDNDYVTPIASTNIFFDGPKEWSVAVKRGTFAEFKDGKTKSAKKDSKTKEDLKTPKDTDEVFYLMSPSGNPLYNFYVELSEPKAEIQIKEALEKYTRVENILALNNGAADAKINEGLRVEMIRIKSEGGTCKAEEYSELELKKMKEENVPIVPGDCYYFKMTNDTNQAFYMYLYTISADGSIQIAYAPTADGDILRRGVSLSTISENGGGNAFRATEPYGKETVKLIATTKRFDASLLSQPSIAKSAVRGSDSALEALFAQVSTNKRSEKVSIPFSGWGTSKMDFEIVEKK